MQNRLGKISHSCDMNQPYRLLQDPPGYFIFSTLHLTIYLLWCRRICLLVLLTKDRKTMTGIFLLSVPFLYLHWGLATEGKVICNGWTGINTQSIVRARTADTQPWMFSLKSYLKFYFLYSSLPFVISVLFVQPSCNETAVYGNKTLYFASSLTNSSITVAERCEEMTIRSRVKC